MTKGELFMLVRIIEEWLEDEPNASEDEITTAVILRDRFYMEFVKEVVQ
jgi:hypothetical protein